MFTGNAEYNRLIYKVEKELISYTVYRLDKASNIWGLKLSAMVRIEPFRGFSASTGIDYYLRGRDATRWSESTLSGLRPEIFENVYSGNHLNGTKCLMLMQLSEDKSLLIIDYFNGFYPNNPSILKDMIRRHDFYLPTIKKEEV